jgi:TetR/AcrR family transcriptional regulator of autoinduction and epiphytic fitness
MRPLAHSTDPRVVRTRARVLHAAMDLLVDVGIRRITMTAIVERSGVSKTTFYRHWTSLEDVVYDAVAARIWPPDEATLDPPTSEQLHDAAEAVANMINDPRTPAVRDALLHLSESDVRFVELRARVRAAILAPLTTTLQAARTAGQLDRTVDIEEVIAQVVGPMIYDALSGRPRTATVAHAHIDRVLLFSSPAEPAPGPSTPPEPNS